MRRSIHFKTASALCNLLHCAYKQFTLIVQGFAAHLSHLKPSTRDRTSATCYEQALCSLHYAYKQCVLQFTLTVQGFVPQWSQLGTREILLVVTWNHLQRTLN